MSGQIYDNTPFEFKANLKALQIITSPVQMVQQFVYSKMSVDSRTIGLVSLLAEYIQYLNSMITNRNNLIDDFKAEKLTLDDKIFPSVYFGMSYAGGDSHEQYRDTVFGISSYTDTSLFCCCWLCRDLNEYGQRIASRFKTEVPEKIKPEISVTDYLKISYRISANLIIVTTLGYF